MGILKEEAKTSEFQYYLVLLKAIWFDYIGGIYYRFNTT